MKQLLTLTLLLGSISLWGQSSEGSLRDARSLAEQKKYEDAIQLLNRAIERDSNSYELQSLRVRVEGWMGNYPQALKDVNELLMKWPGNPELLLLRVDLYYWMQDSNQMAAASKEGFRLHPSEPAFLFRQAQALELLEAWEESLQVVRQYLVQMPEDTRAILLERRVMGRLVKNEIVAGYRAAFFDRTFSNWHNGSLAIIHHTASGPVIARTNFAHQFDRNGVQLEGDYYPYLGKTTYGYFNAGFSASVVFPNLRLGAEVYQQVHKTYEVSLGGRYLKYDLEQVSLVTASVGKYWGNYLVSYRPTVRLGSDNTNVTHFGQVRRYFADRDHFIGVWIAYGAVPVSTVTLAELSRLSSKRAGLEAQRMIAPGKLLRILLEAQKEEFQTNEFRNRLSAEILFTVRF